MYQEMGSTDAVDAPRDLSTLLHDTQDTSARRGTEVVDNRQIVQRVSNGVEELDRQVPFWRDKVKPAILDLHSHRDCVLGQVYESYYVGTLALNLTDDTVIYYGFEAENPADKEEYQALTNEWKRRLTGVTTNA